MLAIEPFRVGRTYHWHVFDILQHYSVDTEYVDQWYCPTCDSDGRDCLYALDHLWEAATLSEVWSATLDHKMCSERYPEIEASLRDLGFVKPCTAHLENGGVAVFGDGHHRIAAALELHIDCIPTLFHGAWDLGYPESRHISEDSGLWRAGDPIV